MSTEVYKINPEHFTRIVFYKNVINTPDIRKRLMEGQFQCSFINPDLIVDAFQVVVAVHKAVNHLALNKMITRNVYTEIIYNLSNSRSIKTSLQTFGTKDADTSLLAVFLDDVAEKEFDKFASHISGEQVPLDELTRSYKKDVVIKEYDVSEAELYLGDLLDTVVGRIATKNLFTR